MEKQSSIRSMGEQLCLILKVGSSVKRWNKLAKQSKDRKYRLGQLVTTQFQYLNDLKLIHQKIQKPLRQSSTISEQQEKQMFPNIQGMIHFSQQIHSDMSIIQAKWNRRETLIAPNMIKYSQFMLVYSDFFKNYQTTEKKLKLLVDNNEIAQKIEKQLVQKPRIETFNNLMSKPFQRPLKYLLLLKQYLRETPKKHPDYKNLEEAVQCYHKVNQRNNEALQHKQKDKMLITLDNIFKDIISSDARYFISQSQATIFDLKVKCYILSDLVLITKMDGLNQLQFARIQINQSSFVTTIKDSIYLKNRLLICGKKYCIHLTFQQNSERDRFASYVNGIITDFYDTKHYKEELRGSRRSTMTSLSFKQSQELSQNDIRISMTQLECSLPQPPRILVLGPIKRIYSSRLTKIYYLTKFQLPFRAGSNDYNQILYIDQQDMIMMERISRIVYCKEKDFMQAPCLEQLLKLMQSNNQVRNQQYKSLYYTLLLNSIFRHPNIAKRTDIFTHKMDVALGLWLQLKYPGFSCSCKNCLQGQIVTTINKYNEELKERFQNRQKPRTFYCPFRIFQVQNTILSMTPQEVKQIQLWNDRLFWINCSRGCLEYRLLDNSPIDMGEQKLVIFYLCCGIQNKKYERHIRRQDRVGQIKCSLSRQLGIDLIQYQMCMEINKITYFLGDDQVLYKLLKNELPPEEGFTNFFKSAFGTKEDTSIKILLKRVWWPVNRSNDLDYVQKVEMRMNLFVEELAYRFKQQQIILNVKDTINFYACYLLYIEIKDEKDIKEALLQCIVASKKWKLLNSKNREEMLQIVRSKFKSLQNTNFPKLQGLELKKNVFQFIVKYLKNKPIWGIYNFEGQYIYQGKTIPVRIGFDLTTFIVKQPQKVTCIFQDNIKSARQKILVSNWEMRIIEEEREYLINGPSFVQMQEMLDMYIQFAQTFVSVTS